VALIIARHSSPKYRIINLLKVQGYFFDRNALILEVTPQRVFDASCFVEEQVRRGEQSQVCPYNGAGADRPYFLPVLAHHKSGDPAKTGDCGLRPPQLGSDAAERFPLVFGNRLIIVSICALADLRTGRLARGTCEQYEHNQRLKSLFANRHSSPRSIWLRSRFTVKPNPKLFTDHDARQHASRRMGRQLRFQLWWIRKFACTDLSTAHVQLFEFCLPIT